MSEGFFALVDDHGWSTPPRIPGRMAPSLPAVGGVLNWDFEAEQPVSFPALYARTVRLGFFAPRGGLLWSSGWMACQPGDSVSLRGVIVRRDRANRD